MLRFLFPCRQRKKSCQPPSSPEGHKQPSSSGFHSEEHLEHIIEELNALKDMAPALSPLPPSPGPAEESCSESSNDAGSEDGDSDYSLGDLADILTGDQGDAENPVGKSLATRDSSQDFDEDLENSFKEAVKGENDNDIQGNKDEPSMNEAPNEFTASVLEESENFSETNCNVDYAGDETSKRETFHQAHHTGTQMSEYALEKDTEPIETAQVFNAAINKAESPGVRQKGKRRMTSPNPQVMTRSRAKAMKLSSSSDGDSSSEKETGKESNIRLGNSSKITNTCSKRNTDAIEKRKSKGTQNRDEREAPFVSFTEALRNQREIRDQGNCSNSLSEAINGDAGDVTPHHDYANERECPGASLSGSKEQLDDDNTSRVPPTETEGGVTCYRGNDDELRASAFPLPGSVEPKVLRENSDAFLSAVDVPTTNMSTVLESVSESQIKTAVPLSPSKEFSSDNNDISLAELSDRTDACTCVSTKPENIEADAKVVACKTNELNDRNLRDSRSSPQATDSGHSSRFKSEEIADNTVPVDNLQTIRNNSKVDSILVDDENWCDQSEAVIEENQEDLSCSAERNSSDLGELSVCSVLDDDRENKTVFETTGSDQKESDVNSSGCKATGKLATCSPIEILTGDAKTETSLAICSKKRSCTITVKTKEESSIDSHHMKEIIVNRQLASKRNADCFASDEAKLGSSTEDSGTERFTDQGANLGEGITALCDDSATKCSSLTHKGRVATTTIITPSVTHTGTNVTHSNTRVSRFKTSVTPTERSMTQTGVTHGKISETHTEKSVTYTKISTKLEISAKEKLKDAIYEDRISLSRAMIQEGSLTFPTGVTLSNLENDLASCKGAPSKEGELSKGKRREYSEFQTDTKSLRTPNKDERKPPVAIELDGDLQSCRNTAADSLVSTDGVRIKSDVIRVSSSFRDGIKDCPANSRQETERTDMERQMPCYSGQSDCNTSSDRRKLSGCKDKISSFEDDGNDHEGRESPSSAVPEQERTQIKSSEKALQLLGTLDTRESPKTSATAHDLQDDPPIEALLNNLEGLLEDFPSLSPLPPSPCPSDDETVVLPASPISNSDGNDVTILMSDAHDKCPGKRDERGLTEPYSKSLKRNPNKNMSGCNTSFNIKDISTKNTLVKTKTMTSESTSSPTRGVLLQRPLQTPLLRSRAQGSVSAKRTLQRSVSDSAIQKNEPRSKRAKKHLSVTDKQQSPKSSVRLVASRVALNKDVMKQPLESCVGNKGPVFVSNKGAILVDQNSNVRPILGKELHKKDSTKATDDKDSKFRPLSVRPGFQTEVQYVIKCLGRIYENNVELEIVFSRLTSKKCISSSTPVASAIIHFLKKRKDDLMPHILEQLEQIQSEGRPLNWKPIISSFESRLLEVVSLLSSEALFGNLIAQLVTLCSRSLIEASCAFKEEEIKGNLSLW